MCSAAPALTRVWGPGISQFLTSAPVHPKRDAILQPPKPEIEPAAKIIELAREQETDREAAD